MSWIEEIENYKIEDHPDTCICRICKEMKTVGVQMVTLEEFYHLLHTQDGECTCRRKNE